MSRGSDWPEDPLWDGGAGTHYFDGLPLFTEVHIPYSAHAATTNISSFKSRKNTLFYNAPFNHFDVRIHNPGPYSFTVYDLSGKIISNLLLDLEVPGSYRIVPQYKHPLESGIYGAKLNGKSRLEKPQQASVIFVVAT